MNKIEKIIELNNAELNNDLFINSQIVRKSFDKAADSYDDFAIAQKKIAKKLCGIIPDYQNINTGGNFVLDVGCGTGYILRNFFSDAFGCQLDVSCKMCNLASKNNADFTITAAAETLPVINNHFKLAISSMALQWVSDLSCTFREIYRVLEKNGFICISMPLPGTFVELDTVFRDVVGGNHVNNFMSRNQIIQLLHAIGFAELRVEQEGITTFYRNFSHLLQTIKKTGVTFKGRSKLFTIKTLKQIENVYCRKYRGAKLSWVIIYILAKKM